MEMKEKIIIKFFFWCWRFFLDLTLWLNLGREHVWEFIEWNEMSTVSRLRISEMTSWFRRQIHMQMLIFTKIYPKFRKTVSKDYSNLAEIRSRRNFSNLNFFMLKNNWNLFRLSYRLFILCTTQKIFFHS